MGVSFKHKNRKSHNWLIYQANDLNFSESTAYLKGKVYDLGCGESPYKNWILRYANEYLGVDWNGSFHNINADIIADLNQPIEISDNVADTVISISVLEHLREPKNMISEAFRILKNNGYFILQVPWQWRVHEEPYDFYRFTPYGLKYLVESAGFSIIQFKAQTGFFSTIFLKFNYFSLRFIRGPKILRGVIRLLLSGLWFCNQKMAPFLDKLDKDWNYETTGYFMICKKA